MSWNGKKKCRFGGISISAFHLSMWNGRKKGVRTKLATDGANKLNLKNVRDGKNVFFCQFPCTLYQSFFYSLIYLSFVRQTFNSKLFSLNTLRTYAHARTQVEIVKQFVGRALTLIVWPIILYMCFFYIHLEVLNHSGNGDGFYSSAFQSQLIGNSLHNATMPRQVAYGAVLTLKNYKTGGGYLHSHYHLYPKGAGAKQQQVRWTRGMGWGGVVEDL